MKEPYMKRHWLALLITLAMVAATYGMIPFITKDNRQQTVQASQGVLDLSQWRFDRDGAVKLDGQWEFYPDRLLGAADFAGEGRPAPDTIAVPSSWTSKTDVYGSATYRLLLHIGEGNRTFGLKTLSIQMSSRIIVNGEEVGSSGIPSGEPSSYEGKNKPSVSYFSLRPGRHGIGKRTEGGTVEIKVHEADGHCRIVIADNGVGMTQEQVASALSMESPISAGEPERRIGVGLRNINKRLKHAYATELHIESGVDAGTTVTVLIPASGL
jgi:hypothetical protein